MIQSLKNLLLVIRKSQPSTAPSEVEAPAPEETLPIDAIIYDCEIARCIPPKWDEEPDPELKYCNGWDDFSGMGISVIAAYDYWADRYRVFLPDNLDDFQALVSNRKAIIGFNSISFDDQLCYAHGLQVTTTYDLLAEVRIASGQPPHYVKGQTRGGYSLEQLAQANLGYGKSGTGSLAPELWQRGQRGSVIDYCLGDVAITKKLFEMRSRLTDPTTGETLTLRDDPAQQPLIF